MKKIVALLQARTDSTRLPKKVLKEILGIPMILQEIKKIKKSKLITDLILVTSNEKSDDELSQLIVSNNISLYRGSKDNVLERFYKCCEEQKLKKDDIVVRLTGDCPLHDAEIIDEAVEVFQNNNVDYLANCIIPIYPDGLDVEVFTFEALEIAYKNAELTSEKEHVTPYIRKNKKFKSMNLEKPKQHPEWRLTVDEPKDFELIEKIYFNFKDREFDFIDVIDYLEKNPNFLKINNTINRNEGYEKSLKEDKIKN